MDKCELDIRSSRLAWGKLYWMDGGIVSYLYAPRRSEPELYDVLIGQVYLTGNNKWGWAKVPNQHYGLLPVNNWRYEQAGTARTREEAKAALMENLRQ